MASDTCLRGHPWTEKNTYIRPDTGGRQCRACARIRDEKNPPDRPRKKKVLKACQMCRSIFETARESQKFCSRPCGYNATLKNQKERQREKPKYPYSRRKEGDFFRKYGITVQQFEDHVTAIGGCCEICGEEKRLIPDHCHDTGKFRGALCQGCNVGIGNLGDTVSSVRRALGYLERTTTN